MPRVCEFFGITVYFYYDDHAPPHFPARYQGQDGTFAIETLALIDGVAKPRVRALVVEWASQRQAELRRAWNQARARQPIDPISPLE